MKLKELTDKPRIVAVVGNVSTGKSMLLYHFLDEIRKDHTVSVFYYGLRESLPDAVRVHSVNEIELIKNSVIVIDEFNSLYDLEDRKSKRSIENSLRLIHHNNNVLILCGVAENFKKFISSKIDIAVYKTCTIADFINGSRLKHILTDYKGNERGSAMLTLDVSEALIFDGSHYTVIKVPYLVQYDTKKANKPICTPKRSNNCDNNVPENTVSDAGAWQEYFQ